MRVLCFVFCVLCFVFCVLTSSKVCFAQPAYPDPFNFGWGWFNHRAHPLPSGHLHAATPPDVNISGPGDGFEPYLLRFTINGSSDTFALCDVEATETTVTVSDPRAFGTEEWIWKTPSGQGTNWELSYSPILINYFFKEYELPALDPTSQFFPLGSTLWVGRWKVKNYMSNCKGWQKSINDTPTGGTYYGTTYNPPVYRYVDANSSFAVCILLDIFPYYVYYINEIVSNYRKTNFVAAGLFTLGVKS